MVVEKRGACRVYRIDNKFRTSGNETTTIKHHRMTNKAIISQQCVREYVGKVE